jgi:hypothetical protein
MTNHHVEAQLNYLAPSVESSLYRNGKVFTRRDINGNDSPFQGAEMAHRNVVINSGRCSDKSARPQLENQGFELLNRPLQNSELPFFDQQHVLEDYYPECERIVQQATGATHVFAFDHNLRSVQSKKNQDIQKQAENTQQVQQPIHYVHGDYTLVSAPQRLRDLASPPRINDTLQSILNASQSLLTNNFVSHIFDNNKRFAIINVWRNIDTSPVLSNPLALCDGKSMSRDDLVVFEVHYDDRIGENYFAKHDQSHQWWYYPIMTRDEVILIKQWDSLGVLNGLDTQRTQANQETKSLPCKFSLHSAFIDPTTPEDAPDRQSIEVRCIAVFDA